jgi:hypothetical protein
MDKKYAGRRKRGDAPPSIWGVFSAALQNHIDGWVSFVV